MVVHRDSHAAWLDLRRSENTAFDAQFSTNVVRIDCEVSSGSDSSRCYCKTVFGELIVVLNHRLLLWAISSTFGILAREYQQLPHVLRFSRASPPATGGDEIPYSFGEVRSLLPRCCTVSCLLRLLYWRCVRIAFEWKLSRTSKIRAPCPETSHSPMKQPQCRPFGPKNTLQLSCCPPVCHLFGSVL